MLRTERSYHRWLTVLVGLVALLKGIQLPDLWTFDQAQFDYRFGFLKRGLPGELFRLVANLAIGVGLFGGRVKTFPLEQAWSSIRVLHW